MRNLRTVSISKLPVLKEEYVSGSDILPIVDVETGTNRTITMDTIKDYTNQIGSIVSFIKSSSVPSNFLPCSGGFINIGAYIDLYKILPETSRFGDSFQLPNLTHPDANLAYYICAGNPRQNVISVPLTSNSSFVTNINAISSSSFTIRTNAGGGYAPINHFKLSAYVVVSPDVFTTPSSLTISFPNSGNQYLFFNNSTMSSAINLLSLTGSTDYGFEATNVQSVQGGTSFQGINSLSALSLNSYLPHLPFLLINNAVGTDSYQNYLGTTRPDKRGNTTISIEVPSFEETVGGIKYKLKSFLVDRSDKVILPQWYSPNGLSATKSIWSDRILTILNPANSGQNIALNSNLSAILGNSRMRAKLLSTGISTSWSGLTAGNNWIPAASGFGFFQKPWFGVNPLRIDGEWGWPVESFVSEYNNLAQALHLSGYKGFNTLNTNVSGFTTWVLSGNRVMFNNNSFNYQTALSSVTFRYKNLSPSNTTTLYSFTAVRDSKKYLNISVPLDQTLNKLIVSYYAR